MYVVQHAIEWVVWHAQHDPAAVDADLKAEYVREVHRALQELLGAVAAVAALSLDLWAMVEAEAHGVYELEGRVARALIPVGRDNTDAQRAVEGLCAFRPEVDALYKRLPDRVDAIMRRAQKAGPRQYWRAPERQPPDAARVDG
jgi:hypothetical protein